VRKFGVTMLTKSMSRLATSPSSRCPLFEPKPFRGRLSQTLLGLRYAPKSHGRQLRSTVRSRADIRDRVRPRDRPGTIRPTLIACAQSSDAPLRILPTYGPSPPTPLWSLTPPHPLKILVDSRETGTLLLRARPRGRSKVHGLSARRAEEFDGPQIRLRKKGHDAENQKE